MIVVDASVLTNLLVYAGARGDGARAVLGRDPAWAAPEHWKAEVFSAIRRLVVGRKVDLDTAGGAIRRVPHIGVESVALDPLVSRMWELRDNLTGHGAVYVVLAEARALTLVTADRWLAAAAVSRCRVELVGTTGGLP